MHDLSLAPPSLQMALSGQRRIFHAQLSLDEVDAVAIKWIFSTMNSSRCLSRDFNAKLGCLFISRENFVRLLFVWCTGKTPLPFLLIYTAHGIIFHHYLSRSSSDRPAEYASRMIHTRKWNIEKKDKFDQKSHRHIYSWIPMSCKVYRPLFQSDFL